jgi:hypothetical protein
MYDSCDQFAEVATEGSCPGVLAAICAQLALQPMYAEFRYLSYRTQNMSSRSPRGLKWLNRFELLAYGLNILKSCSSYSYFSSLNDFPTCTASTVSQAG